MNEEVNTEEYNRCIELFNEFFESEENFPNGDDSVSDWYTYKDFMDSISEGEFIKFPGLESCLSNKIISRMFEILDDLYERLLIDDDTYDDYINIFEINKIDGNNKYKFLEKETVSNLKYILQKSGYKNYSKLNKKQLIFYITRELEK